MLNPPFQISDVQNNLSAEDEKDCKSLVKELFDTALPCSNKLVFHALCTMLAMLTKDNIPPEIVMEKYAFILELNREEG